jgi:hypothetical protein
MSIYGYGYRYPRRKRKVSVETYIGDKEDQQAWAKAAVFNKAIAEQNPWVQHLRKTKTYDPVNPEKRKKALARRMTHIGQEVEVIDKDYPDLQKDYTYTIPYNDAKQKAVNKLVKEANMLHLQNGIDFPKGIPKFSLDVLFPGEEWKSFREYYGKTTEEDPRYVNL